MSTVVALRAHLRALTHTKHETYQGDTSKYLACTLFPICGKKKNENKQTNERKNQSLRTPC